MNNNVTLNLQLRLEEEGRAQIDKICADLIAHEQETVKLNFRLGDLLNQMVAARGGTIISSSKYLEGRSGVGRVKLETNARVARRLPSQHRPDKVPWGVIQYLFSEINPLRLQATEQDFCDAAIKALKKLAEQNIKLVDLKVESGGYSKGEITIKSFL